MASFLLVMPACADSSENDGFHQFNCKSIALEIPIGYVIKTSRFPWIDAAQGLDDSDCSIRLVFNEVADIPLVGLKSELNLKVVLSATSSSNSGNRALIEGQASRKEGVFQSAKYVENLLPGVMAVFEDGISSSSYIFKDHGLSVFSYIGSCSGQDFKLSHCVFVHRYNGVQLEFSLNGPQIDMSFYSAIIQLFEAKVDEWSV